MLIRETHIKYGQYANDFNVEHVLVGSTVQIIGDFAFSRCNNLCSIDFSQAYSLSSIGMGSFYKCISLTAIALPPSLIHIGQECFHRCYSLSNITLPLKLEHIPEFAFDRCRSLREIEIPFSVKSIGERAFSFCDRLERVRLPACLHAEISGNIDKIFLESFPDFEIV